MQQYLKRSKRIKERTQRNIDTNRDIWAETDFRSKVPGLKCEGDWISRKTSLHVVKNLGVPVVKVHDSIHQKTTKLK